MSVTQPTEFEPTGETTYDHLQAAVEEYGEVMVRFDSGLEAELHRHNVSFEGPPTVKVATPAETRWFDAEKVESYWIHSEF